MAILKRLKKGHVPPSILQSGLLEEKNKEKFIKAYRLARPFASDAEEFFKRAREAIFGKGIERGAIPAVRDILHQIEPYAFKLGFIPATANLSPDTRRQFLIINDPEAKRIFDQLVELGIPKDEAYGKATGLMTELPQIKPLAIQLSLLSAQERKLRAEDERLRDQYNKLIKVRDFLENERRYKTHIRTIGAIPPRYQIFTEDELKDLGLSKSAGLEEVRAKLLEINQLRDTVIDKASKLSAEGQRIANEIDRLRTIAMPPTRIEGRKLTQKEIEAIRQEALTREPFTPERTELLPKIARPQLKKRPAQIDQRAALRAARAGLSLSPEDLAGMTPEEQRDFVERQIQSRIQRQAPRPEGLTEEQRARFDELVKAGASPEIALNAVKLIPPKTTPPAPSKPPAVVTTDQLRKQILAKGLRPEEVTQQTLPSKLQEFLATAAPKKPDLVETFQELREREGVEALEDSINQLRDEQDKLLNEFRAFAAAERERGGAVSSIVAKKISEQERALMERIDFLRRQEQLAVNKLNAKNALISDIMRFAQTDFQNSLALYNAEFSKALRLYNVIDRQEQRAINDAKAFLNTAINLMRQQNISFDELDDTTKAWINQQALTAGYPPGAIEAFLRYKPDAKIIATRSVTFEDGTQGVAFVFEDPKTGGIGTTQVVRIGGTKARQPEEAGGGFELSPEDKRVAAAFEIQDLPVDLQNKILNRLSDAEREKFVSALREAQRKAAAGEIPGAGPFNLDPEIFFDEWIIQQGENKKEKEKAIVRSEIRNWITKLGLKEVLTRKQEILDSIVASTSITPKEAEQIWNEVVQPR